MLDVKEAIDQTLEDFGIPTKIKRLNPKEAETVYASAYGLYEASQYAQAAELFLHLVFSNSFEQKYWRGLAASKQMEGKYVDALHAWALVALLVETDPEPHFYAAECLVSLGNKEEAAKALSAAEERAGNDLELHDKLATLKGLL